MDAPGWQAAFLSVLNKDPSPVSGSRRLMHPVGRWAHGTENVINLFLCCILEIDTHQFGSHCFHLVGEKQPTTWSYPDARVAKKCTPARQLLPREGSGLGDGGQSLLNSVPSLLQGHR